MKSICLYSSYFNQSAIPHYVRFYLDNLISHFSELLFLTNKKELGEESLSYLSEKKIRLVYVENNGWDFGMWYQALQQFDVKDYDRVGLINDSCILFKPLDQYFEWLNNQHLDFAGMLDSEQFSYHVQSYFIVINKNAVAETLNYFKLNGLQADRKGVIEKYELGLSKHIKDKGLRMGAFYSYKNYPKVGNQSVFAIKELIKDGFPLIKKKIIFRTFSREELIDVMKHPFRFNPDYYFSLIQVSNPASKLFDFNLLRYDGLNKNIIGIIFLFLCSLVLRFAKVWYDLFKKLRN